MTPPNWDPPEHPEDRSIRLRREAYGRAHATTFAKAHERSMVRLIELYGDHDAQEALENLRELFWAEQWTPEDTAVLEPHHPAPPAQALPDDRRGLGTRGGAGSWGSELAPMRKRSEGVLAAGEWSDDDAKQCFADRRQLFTMLDRAASDMGWIAEVLRISEEFGSAMKTKVDDLTRAVAIHEATEKGLAADVAALTTKIQRLEQDLAFERAKNEGRVTEGGGL